MKLNSVTLKNFCQHKSKKVEFAPGLNMILGANGSGKSNLINSVYSCLTNDFSRFHGNKLQQISQFAANNEPSYIDLSFEHGPTKLFIHRGLEPNSKYLNYDGHKISKETEIANTLESIIGVSSAILADYVFVDQWQVAAFLSHSASDRAKAMQKLFGTEKAEICWDLIGKAISKLSIPITIVDEDIVRQKIIKCKQELKILNAKLSQLNAIPVENRNKLQKVMADYAVKAQLNDDFTELVNDVIKWRTRLNKWRHRIKWQSRQVKIVADFRNKLQAYYTKLQEDLLSYKNRVAVQKQIAELNAVEGELLRSIDDFELISERTHISEDNVQKLEAKILSTKLLIDAIDSTGKRCPTCGSDITHLHTDLDRDTHRVDVFNLALYKKHLEIYKSAKQALKPTKQQQASLKKLLEQTPASELSDKEIIIEIGNIRSTIVSIKKLEDLCKSDKSQFNFVYPSYKKSMKALYKLVRQLSNLKVTEEEVEIAKGKLQEANDIAVDKKEVTTKIALLSERIKEEEITYQELLAVKQSAQNTKDAVAHLESIREILHRDSLPKIVAQQYLVELTSKINDILGTFDSPFKVEMTNGLSFQALFNDGRDVPAEALSGGERAIFAIAYRIVINSTFASEIGLLCLDEPTAGLDETNIRCLTIALDNLKQLSKSTGLQCIIITHEKALTPYFDKVIEL